MLEILSEKLGGRVLIIGVGNALRGDDGLGPFLINRMKGRIGADLLDCGEVPENFLHEIAEFCPKRILVVDAVDFGKPAGSAAVLNPEELAGSSLSTHRLSLQLLARYLKMTIGSEVFLLGVQPKTTAPGSKMSEEVLETLGILQRLMEESFAVSRQI